MAVHRPRDSGWFRVMQMSQSVVLFFCFFCFFLWDENSSSQFFSSTETALRRKMWLYKTFSPLQYTSQTLPAAQKVWSSSNYSFHLRRSTTAADDLPSSLEHQALLLHQEQRLYVFKRYTSSLFNLPVFSTVFGVPRLTRHGSTSV